MSGIKETKEVVVFLAKVGEGVEKALADGKIDLSDALDFTGAVMAIGAAVSGVGEVPSELKDLDASEAAELVNAALAELPHLSGKALGVVKAALAVVVSVSSLVSALKA